MEDKVVYNGEMPERETKEYVLSNGQAIKVKSWLTHEEQIACAMEYAREMCVIDDEKKVSYPAYDERYATAIAYCNAYTNLDFESVIKHAGSTRIVDEIIAAVQMCGEDYFITKEIMTGYADITRLIYREYNSLPNKLMVALGGLIDNGDMVKGLVENPEINNQMIEMINKARMVDEGKVTPFAWAKKKN